jgi:hypothetical protein
MADGGDGSLRRSGRFSGGTWDSQKIRRIREFGWFLEHEADMIEAARRRVKAERVRRQAELRERLVRSRLCPACGRRVKAPPIEDTGVSQCADCGAFFFDHGEVGQLRLEPRRRGGTAGRDAAPSRDH